MPGKAGSSNRWRGCGISSEEEAGCSKGGPARQLEEARVVVRHDACGGGRRWRRREASVGEAESGDGARARRQVDAGLGAQIRAQVGLTQAWQRGVARGQVACGGWASGGGGRVRPSETCPVVEGEGETRVSSDFWTGRAYL